MRNLPLRPHQQVKRASLMPSRIAAEEAGSALYGATKALRAAEAALMKAPSSNPHGSDGLSAVRAALREVLDASACTNAMVRR